MKKTFQFNTKIGIIGGGQLGKMLIESSRPWNIQNFILENDSQAPASNLAHEQIIGSLNDAEKINELASKVDVLTYEIEHINVDALLKLESQGKNIIPRARCLDIIKDKGKQKQFYSDNGIKTSSFYIVQKHEEWLEAAQKLGKSVFVAKSCTDGYDGKGVSIINIEDLINQGSNFKFPFSGETLIEEFIENQKEISVIVACDSFGNMANYPVVEMVFDPEANLVDFLASPARISPETEKEAISLALKTVKAFNSPGIFAVEMFLDHDGNVWVNEIAPRPHNSGHHTIEANYTSQYEQLNRILLGLPLGSCEAIEAAAMVNLLGASDFSGTYYLEGLEEALSMEGVYIHLYGKKESKPKRKMGHFTVLGKSIEEVEQKAYKIKEILKFKPDGK